MHACECCCQCEPDYFSSLLRGQVIDCDVIDLHELVARDEPTICRTTCTHKTSLCCHISGRPMGLHSHGHRGWWQTVARILPIYFPSHTDAEFSSIQSQRDQNPIPFDPYASLSLFTPLQPGSTTMFSSRVTVLFCLLFSVFCHFTASNKASSYCC